MRYTVRMSGRLFIIVALLFVPSLVWAAGFARDSLFLSTQHPVEDSTVLIHAVVSNESSSAFAGELTFTEGESAVGSVPVSLAVGEAQALSVSWKPLAGAHTITAVLTDTSGAEIGRESATFSVAEKPKTESPQTSSAGAGADSSQTIQQNISNLSPGLAEAVAPAFSIVDSARGKAIDAIDRGITWAKEQTGEQPVGSVLGEATEKQNNSLVDKLWFFAGVLALYVLSVLRYVVAHAGVFYPALVVLFFYFLWRLYRRMRRPAWQR